MNCPLQIRFANLRHRGFVGGMILKALRILLFLLMIAGSLAVSSCSAENGEGLYETAQFEELQNNPEHAGKLYKEIIEKYPESEYADKAKARISALSKE